MSKFARAASPTMEASTISATVPDAITHEGGAGYKRPAKEELFLLAVTNMVSEQTFYESGDARDARFEALVKAVVDEDPAWVAAFVPVLREALHMRSASIVMAAIYARVALERHDSETPAIRGVIASALRRADEPAEMLAYWTTRWGRKVPKPVKRGIADAVVRLYNERNALKWDSDKATVRMGDVIELVHPSPSGEWQSALFRYLIDDRHGRPFPGQRPGDEDLKAIGLRTIAARKWLEAMSPEERAAFLDSLAFPDAYRDAAGTWEWLSSWVSPMPWERAIPEMGYMALLRNLRNFDKAAISDEARTRVVQRLTDPDEVARSKQLPLRFYSAYKATDPVWHGALETALGMTIKNIPSLTGRTLAMVDVSGSMASGMSGRSQALRWELAALFGAALIARNEGALFAFSNSAHAITPGETILGTVKDIGTRVGGGTLTWQSTEQAFATGRFDRIVIITDEQAWADRAWGNDGLSGHERIPAHVPIYTFNVAGYAHGHAPSSPASNRHTFGGLTDAGFEAIALIEGATEGVAA